MRTYFQLFDKFLDIVNSINKRCRFVGVHKFALPLLIRFDIRVVNPRAKISQRGYFDANYVYSTCELQ